MCKKILIAEDVDSIGVGVFSILHEKFPEMTIQIAKYCDEALLKITKAALENEPFELLITDLSFKDDFKQFKLSSGQELIRAVKARQPDIDIIVYSVEDRPFIIKNLLADNYVYTYINKSRESASQLTEAIKCLKEGKPVSSSMITGIVKDHAFHEIDEYDISLLKLLSEGNTQESISNFFSDEGLSPSSISSIEKRINKLKIFFKANNTIHLITIAKNLGIIE